MPTAAPVRLSVGIIALALLLIAEILFNIALQSQTLGAYIASRDPVSGSVYLALLVLFVVTPLILARVQLVLARVQLDREMGHQSVQGNNATRKWNP